MVITNMMGGFGNNLFQIANIIQVSNKLGVEFKTNGTPQRGNAGNFNGNEFEFNRIFKPIDNFIDVNVHNTNVYRHRDVYPQYNFSYCEVPLLDNVSYEGYFQSEKYFKDINIRDYFVFNDLLIKTVKEKYEISEDKKYTTLHLRHGGDRIDSQTQYFHKNVSTEFYLKSLSVLPNSDKKFIISDNINLSKEIFKNYDDVVFVDDSMENCFTLMSLCNYNVIGNSTFSWWASYLNLNEDTITVAPKKEWFGPGYSHFILDDLFPSKWVCF